MGRIMHLKFLSQIHQTRAMWKEASQQSNSGRQAGRQTDTQIYTHTNSQTETNKERGT